jgi:hypothetical protein
LSVFVIPGQEVWLETKNWEAWWLTESKEAKSWCKGIQKQEWKFQ